jgi:two-component system secretion response regulator SsrB
MPYSTNGCVLVADQHHGLSEGVRGLLESAFEWVFMVGDEPSLLEGAQRLQPQLLIVDVTLAQGDIAGLVGRVLARSPGSKVVLLTVHDTSTVVDAARHAGAHAVVLKRAIATDLLPAVDAVHAGRDFVSPAICKA